MGNVVDKASIVELLEFTANVLEDSNVPFWLDYGTLLGAVRGGKFIDGDSDADICVYIRDLGYIKSVLNECVVNNYRVYDAFKGTGLQLYRAPGKEPAHIDLFGWFEADGVMRRTLYIPGNDNNKGKDFPAEWLNPLTTIEFEGRVYPAPRSPEQMCEFRYGPTWKTPMGAKEFNETYNPNR